MYDAEHPGKYDRVVPFRTRTEEIKALRAQGFEKLYLHTRLFMLQSETSSELGRIPWESRYSKHCPRKSRQSLRLI